MSDTPQYPEDAIPGASAPAEPADADAAPEPLPETEPVAAATIALPVPEAAPAAPVTAAPVTAAAPAPAPNYVPPPTQVVAPQPVSYYGYAGQAESGPIALGTPVPPVKQHNRVAGALIAIVGAVVFAVASAAAVYGILIADFGESRAQSLFATYVESWSFWLPFAVFVIAFLLLALIVNRGGWWGYVLGSAIVAALVFVAYLAAVLISAQAWRYSFDQARSSLVQFVRGDTDYLWITVASAFIALEVVVWFGLLIAARGRVVTRRNAEARAEFDRSVAAPDAQQAPDHSGRASIEQSPAIGSA